jgi:molybdenum cofactor biosynthesis enzyme
MADVSGKEATAREAVAEGWVRLSGVAREMIRDGRTAKGDGAAAALCVHDRAKPVDRGIRIEGIRQLRKTGGKSGDYLADAPRIARRRIPASRKTSYRSAGERGPGPKRSR